MKKTDFSDYLSATEYLQIPFHDLDPTGVVWHGRYFKYFDLARCALLDEFDYGYKQMKNSGYLWPVVDTSVRFVRPLTLNQEIRVTAILREWELRLVMDYRIEDEQNQLCTRARTVQVPVNAESFELILGSPEILIENVRKRLQIQSSKAE